jgi:hypothetical protein
LTDPLGFLESGFWPYVVPLKETYLFSDVKEIDFTIPVDKKPASRVKRDIDRLIAKALPVRDLHEKALMRDPTCPNFPVNGSASRINRIFEELILEQSTDFFVPHEDQGTDLLEERLSEGIERWFKMAAPTVEQLQRALAEAQAKLKKAAKAAKKGKGEWKPSFPGQHKGY